MWSWKKRRARSAELPARCIPRADTPVNAGPYTVRVSCHHTETRQNHGSPEKLSGDTRYGLAWKWSTMRPYMA